MKNVILIVCDQLRRDYLSMYGADFIPTPNLDQLASEGCVFDNAITASTVCAPARAAMVTGLPVSAHDAWTNQIPPKEGVVYLPERLNALGVMTAAFGCYDHAPKGNTIDYQECHPLVDGRNNEHLPVLQKAHPEADTSYMKDGLQFRYTEPEHYDRFSCDQACEFLRRPQEKPFFLYCGFVMPHGPYAPPKEMRGRVDPDRIPEPWPMERTKVPSVEQYRRASLTPTVAFHPDEDPEGFEAFKKQRKAERLAYCEMICEIDDLVGRLVQTLKETGQYENTVLLFTADHGSMENDLYVDTKGPWPYTPSLFIPMMIVHAPGLAAGSRSDVLCGNRDVGATVLRLMGDDAAFGFSRSMINMTTGSEPKRTVNFSEFCDSVKTAVDERFTFSYYPFTGTWTLFDRLEDPHFQHDLSEDPAYQAAVQAFLGKIIDFMVLSKGVRIEAHDLTPEVRQGIEQMDPKFMDSFEICYPLARKEEVERIRAAGLDADYEEFCRTKPVTAHYGLYWV